MRAKHLRKLGVSLLGRAGVGIRFAVVNLNGHGAKRLTYRQSYPNKTDYLYDRHNRNTRLQEHHDEH